MRCARCALNILRMGANIHYYSPYFCVERQIDKIFCGLVFIIALGDVLYTPFDQFVILVIKKKLEQRAYFYLSA